MRRLLALAAVVAIGVVAMPAGADSLPPQPELEEHQLTADGEVAAEGFVDEVEITDDEVGLVGLKWNGDEDVEFRVLVQNRDGVWEELDDVEHTEDGPDADTEEARLQVERRGSEYVTEPLVVDDPETVRVEVEDGVATDVEVVTVTTPVGGGDDGVGEPDEASALPRAIVIVTLAGLAIALLLPANRRRLAATASLMAVVMGLSVMAAACTPSKVPATQPSIISRAGWGANESLRNCGPQYASVVNQGIIHHTAGGNSYTAAAAPGIVRGIYQFHTQANGWCDIGYNFLVDRYGRIYEGRAGGIGNRVIGAHAANFNTGSFGVAIMGNFQVGAPTNASVDALVRLFVWKMSHHGINPYQGVLRHGGWYDTIVGHRDVNATSCPGWELYKRLGEIRNRVKPNVVHGIPIGNYEAAIRSGSQVRVIGWAIDPNTTGPINVHVYHGFNRSSLNGAGSFVANAPRADVGAAYPGFGPNHGFDATITVGPGIVCVYAINVGPGVNRDLGCRGVW